MEQVYKADINVPSKENALILVDKSYITSQFCIVADAIQNLKCMWIPEYFRFVDRPKIDNFIREVGLATLICNDDPFPMATHIPMELEQNDAEEPVLRGHIARANPQSELFKSEPKVLAIFLSPAHHYISSSWYEKPNAPTWNYSSVHLYGQLKIITGQALWDSVARLTARHEQISRHPVSLDSLPKHIQNMLQGVTGFEITIEKIEAANKLSQNRHEQDYQNIIRELAQLPSPQAHMMSEVMDKHKQT